MYEQAIQSRESIFLNDLKTLNERKEQEKKDNKEVADDREKKQREMMKAQMEQFASIRQQINSLFNTGNMESSINRVGDLIQVLIDKTER